jgi:uncharacterized protein YbjT (DUF2867 family)
MDPIILLTGATGYVGGRLLRTLEAQNVRIRCLARHPEFLQSRVGPHIEVRKGDVLQRETLPSALEGVETAYYLVHSMSSESTFEEQDSKAARNFGEVARQAGVRRIVYLGGLGSDADNLSTHLKSRQKVGEVLRESGVPVVELRASIVIGSGSLSFEIIRALVERLPVMIAPRWVATPTQPIAIEDVISYLVEAIDLPHGENKIFEIGGADQVSYGEIMHEYARQRGLHRLVIPVPLLTPRLSSLWLTLVSPVYARIGRLLIEGLRNPTLVRDPLAGQSFKVRPMGVCQAVTRALQHEDREVAETRWSDALSAGPGVRSWGGQRFGSRIVDSRAIEVDRPPAVAFRAIQRIGGDQGWYYGDWLWRLRGLIDSFFGGVGLRRGRKDPEQVQVGDTLDFWRVEAFEPNRLLRLFAEMKVPGRAWLEFEVTDRDDGATIRQTAMFDPIGLFGLAYWYALYPLHRLIFDGMLSGIASTEMESKS